MRNLWVGYKGLVSSVKKNYSLASAGEIDPLFQNFPCCHRSGRIIRKAKVNNIYFLLRYIRDETISRCAGHIDNFAILAVFVGLAGPAGHHISVHIYRIYGVGYGNDIIQAEYFLDIARVALGAIADKNF